ncbi:PRA1 family protein [Moritella viscosa]|uniref:PRA1 family protein n=1 Tax=Moritella viscosa TaxID=80854 RepID=A0A1L0E2T0_9GAMM|nr:PRA1 family protein [Moritella viscosa]SGZ02586.1 PRA1 family protein [Moritella viscosa]SHO07298.1 PRA1 family protein [Moritella viscosa]SHO07389.1 PRA1 family protein [Moritella viscosa]SHO08330.1 PRA1 family protein [Moritella viscosa]
MFKGNFNYLFSNYFVFVFFMVVVVMLNNIMRSRYITI